MYKKSMFNVYINDEEKDKFIIYNTYTKAIVQYNTQEDWEEAVKEGKNEDIGILYRNGFLVKSKREEIKKIAMRQNMVMYMRTTLSTILITTLNCNFRCPYCFETHRNKKLDVEAIDRLKEFYDRYTMRNKHLSISWFGGEPILAIDEIFELNQYIANMIQRKRLTYYASMPTNGYCITSPIADKLISELKLNRIGFTLDGPPHLHNKTRILASGEGTYSKVIDGISLMVEAKKKHRSNILIQIRVNISLANAEAIEEWLYTLPKEFRGHVRIVFAQVQILSTKTVECHDTLFSNRIEFDKKRRKWEKICIRLGYKPKNDVYYYPLRYGVYCGAECINQFVIGPDATLYGCSTNVEKKDQIGEIDKQGQVSYDYVKLNTWMECADDECKDCALLPICNGGCKGQRYLGNRKCGVKHVNVQNQVLNHLHNEEVDPLYEYLFDN